MSGNYDSTGSSEYEDDEICVFNVVAEAKIEVVDFNTEYYYDILKVGGDSYSGTGGPHQVVTSPNSKIEWEADYSFRHFGWKLCPKTSEAMTTSTTTAAPMTEKGCACQQEWSFRGENVNYCGNPKNFKDRAWCKVVDSSCEKRIWGYCA